jgi:two-component system LytT family response regulator
VIAQDMGGENGFYQDTESRLLLTTDAVDWVEAVGNSVYLYVGGRTHRLRQSIEQLETQLERDKFIRINRTTIVNVERIRELQPWHNDEYIVVMQNGTRLTLSRAYRDKALELLRRMF